MSSSNNLDALFADAELPFYFEDFNDRHEPPPVDPSEEGIVHYGPGDGPICGTDSHLAVHTDDPRQVAGCEDAWSWWPRTSETTITTPATAYTADNRSEPSAAWPGAGRSGGRVLTAARGWVVKEVRNPPFDLYGPAEQNAGNSTDDGGDARAKRERDPDSGHMNCRDCAGSWRA